MNGSPLLYFHPPIYELPFISLKHGLVRSFLFFHLKNLLKILNVYKLIINCLYDTFLYIVNMLPRCDVHIYFMYGRDLKHRFYNQMYG